MKTRTIFLLLGVILFAMSACSASPPLRTPIPTLVPLPSFTPIPTPTPASAINSLLEYFPLIPGTTWIYTYTYYDTAPGDPTRIITQEFQIRELVADILAAGPDWIAHVSLEITPVKLNSDMVPAQLDSKETWYILHNKWVFSSDQKPDPLHLTFEHYRMEYSLPLKEQAAWCISQELGQFAGPGTSVPDPCPIIGRRVVTAAATFQNEQINAQKCYEMIDVFNGGMPNQLFCEGIGVVRQKFDHAGTRFGFSKELVEYKSGTH